MKHFFDDMQLHLRNDKTSSVIAHAGSRNRDLEMYLIRSNWLTSLIRLARKWVPFLTWTTFLDNFFGQLFLFQTTFSNNLLNSFFDFGQLSWTTCWATFFYFEQLFWTTFSNNFSYFHTRPLCLIFTQNHLFLFQHKTTFSYLNIQPPFLIFT